MKDLSIFYITLFFGFVFFIFRNWFLTPQIIGGDWPYFFDETFKNYSFFFSSWNPFESNGFGGMSPIYPLGIFHGFTVFLSNIFHISWPLTYKFSWFGLFIIFSIFSSMHLLKTVLPQTKFWQQIFSAMIFTTNTYILMVVSGGQMGVALAYSLAPLVLARFIKTIHHSSFIIHHSVLAGLVLAVQVMFDPRIAYLTMIPVVMYYVLGIEYHASKKNILTAVAIPLGIVLLLHSTWILPLLFLQATPIPQGFTSVDGFRFFSFADFSHAFSLLHPNWPENIFGKTYFLKPEFLLLPILAFNSLLFRSKIKDQKLKIHILFFALLGLMGAFLAKGTNPPFGQVNQWLFVYVPGMILFRDPTKFYLLIVLSYSVLIPFSLSQIYYGLNSKFNPPTGGQKLQLKVQKFLPNAFLLFAFCFLLFLIRPAVFGELGGTFQKREVPPEYVELKDFLYRQPGFFRTLWIPRQHRFSYYSLTHVPVEANPLFKKAKITDIVNQFRKVGTEEYLSKLGIKYVIVPYDQNGEIFVKDRKYDSVQYAQAIRQMTTIKWLKKIDGFEKIAVFETRMVPKDLFWLEGKGAIRYVADNSTHYSIIATIDSPQKLIFSENFHPTWQFLHNGKIIHTEKTILGLNSFLLTEGNYQGNVVFSGDIYYTYGKIISFSTFVLLVIFLLQYIRKKYTIHKYKYL